MTSLSFKIYLTSNLLIAGFIMCVGMPLSTAALLVSLAVLAFSLIFSIPAGFALYFCFRLADAIKGKTWLRWAVFSVLLFLAGLIPYLFASGFLSGELASKDLQGVLYMSEGSAFVATLFHIIPIHRLLKNTSHEND
jgi:hypothetical protein